jgi:hypothetical protein
MKERISRPAIVMIIGVAALAYAGGCKSYVERMKTRMESLNDKRLHDVLDRNLTATGGMGTWSVTTRIEADAVASILDEEGGGYSLVRQKITLEPGETIRITVVSQNPDGITFEQLDGKGGVRMIQHKGTQVITMTDPLVLRGTALKLRLLAQAMTQTAGLLETKYNVRYSGQDRMGGRLTDKLDVSGDLLRKRQKNDTSPPDQLAIWVDAQKNLFDRMWMCYPLNESPKSETLGYLAVNIGKYEKTMGGLVLPKYIDYVRSDKYQQFSERQMLILEIQQYRVVLD